MNVYHRFFSEPFAITNEGAITWAQTFRYEAPAAKQDAGKTFFGDSRPRMEIRNGVAIVPIVGPVIKGAGFLEKGFGAMGHEEISAMLDEAASSNASRALLLINSPGGSVAGTPETANQIKAMRMPVDALIDGTGASSVYWMAAAANRVFATPSSQIGSIGAVLEVTSIARALQAAGIDRQVFASAEKKPLGNPALPITDAAKEHFQARVDAAGKMFTDFVTARRPKMARDGFSGAIYFAAEAQRLGLIDGVVNGLSDLLGQLAPSRPAASSAPRPVAAVQSAPITATAPAIPWHDFEARWNADPDLQAEFSSWELFAAYERGTHPGKMRELEVERLIKLGEGHLQNQRRR